MLSLRLRNSALAVAQAVTQGPAPAGRQERFASTLALNCSPPCCAGRDPDLAAAEATLEAMLGAGSDGAPSAATSRGSPRAPRSPSLTVRPSPRRFSEPRPEPGAGSADAPDPAPAAAPAAAPPADTLTRCERGQDPAGQEPGAESALTAAAAAAASTAASVATRAAELAWGVRVGANGLPIVPFEQLKGAAPA